ncbi:MarR family transcriptional regulator [Streptomyces mirabilis]|uniref:MarR family transcriptional regulator n=1 Tax=Streptomyces mirabilis TaxID=68239 RepID=UPI0033A55D17
MATRAARRLPRDMSLTSAATLATLDRTGPRRITDLAAVEGVTQPAMTTLVRVMEESGLVAPGACPVTRWAGCCATWTPARGSPAAPAPRA